MDASRVAGSVVRLIGCTVLALGIVAGSARGGVAPSAAAARNFCTATVTAKAGLNLRAGPSTKDKILLVLPFGAVVELTGQSANGFLSVRFKGVDGWAFAQFLALQPCPVVPKTAVTTVNLNLRAGPSLKDKILLVMPAGSTVTLTGQSANGFLSVRFKGVDGWAFAQFLRLT